MYVSDIVFPQVISPGDGIFLWYSIVNHFVFNNSEEHFRVWLESVFLL